MKGATIKRLHSGELWNLSQKNRNERVFFVGVHHNAPVNGFPQGGESGLPEGFDIFMSNFGHFFHVGAKL